MILFLTGYRGSGKSTIATLVAARLGCPVYDTDRLIELQQDRSIEAIFANGGETEFRALETAVINDLVNQHPPDSDPVVVSLGGGAILSAENRAMIGTGRNVWLTADADILWQRISSDPATELTRPDLSDEGGLAEVESILRSRTASYEECADYSIDTGELSAREATVAIVQWLQTGR